MPTWQRDYTRITSLGFLLSLQFSTGQAKISIINFRQANAKRQNPEKSGMDEMSMKL
jgi:hypothetical protein